jgi:hypothetical protein
MLVALGDSGLLKGSCIDELAFVQSLVCGARRGFSPESRGF